jgi:hypothetical protein
VTYWHPAEIFIKVIAQKVIFSLNYFADPQNQYCMSEVEDLIEQYSADASVLLNMMNLKQLFKHSYDETGYQKLSRTAIEVLLIKDFETLSSPHMHLKHVIALTQQGVDGKKILREKLGYYQAAQSFKNGSRKINNEYALLQAIAEKAKKTLDHLSKSEYSVSEIIELIASYLSDEKDLYRLLNLHEFYGVDNIQYNRNELLKDAIFCLIKDHLTFEKAIAVSADNAGRTSRKELQRIVNNIKIKENNKGHILRLINKSTEISELKNLLGVYKDEELRALLERYNLLDYVQVKYPEYFKNHFLNKEEQFINKTQYVLRRIFAEVLVNKIDDIEELAYFVIGRRDKEAFLRNVANYETLTELYPVSFETFMKLKDEKLSSGQSVLEVMREAILNDAFNSHEIEDEEFNAKYKKYNLEKIIKNIKWHLERDNIDFNIKSVTEIIDIISSALDRYGPDIYLLERIIGGEIRKNKDEILDIIIENNILSEKYERLESLSENKKLAVVVSKLGEEDLELMLLEETYSAEQKAIIRNEYETKSSLRHQQERENQKKAEKQRSILEKEFDKLADIFDAKLREKILALLETKKIDELKTFILARSFAVKARLYIRCEEGNKFLKQLELDRKIFNELKKEYIPSDGQFTKGHMDKIKRTWGLTANEVHSLGDIIGNSGRKARK